LRIRDSPDLDPKHELSLLWRDWKIQWSFWGPRRVTTNTARSTSASPCCVGSIKSEHCTLSFQSGFQSDLWSSLMTLEGIKLLMAIIMSALI
jgi:hypothetical protein